MESEPATTLRAKESGARRGEEESNQGARARHTLWPVKDIAKLSRGQG